MKGRDLIRGHSATLKTTFVVIGFAFLLDGVIDAWSQADGNLFPGVATLLASAGLWGVGLGAALVSWTDLLGQRNRAITKGFFVSQVAKYVPGGIWQGLGLVKSADEAGVPARHSGPAYGAFVVTQVAAAAPISLSLLVIPSVDLWVRVSAVAGVATLALLDRRWMAAVVRRLPETAGVTAEILPSQRRILRAWVGNVVSLACSSVAFFLLLADITADTSARAVGAFAAAWFVGFVVAPIPAGLGLRELVLLAILRSGVDGELVLTASAYHRVISLAVEAIVAVAMLIGWRRTSGRPGS